MKTRILSTLAVGVLAGTTLVACGEQAGTDVISDAAPAAAVSQTDAAAESTPEFPANRTDSPQSAEEQAAYEQALGDLRANIPLPDTLPEITVVDAANVRPPLENLTKPSGPEADTRYRVAEDATAQCMTEQGFAYTPYYGDPEVEAVHQILFNPPHFASEQEYIDYAMRRAVATQPDQPSYSGTDDPHGISDMGTKDGKAFEDALYGDIKAGKGVQGCELVGLNAAYGDNEKYNTLFRQIEDLAHSARAVAQDHPEVLAAEVKRDECFNAKFSPDEREANGRAISQASAQKPVPQDLSAKNQSIAKAEAECDITSGFVQKRGAAFQVAEQEARKNNQSLIEEFTKLQNHAVKAKPQS